MSNKFQGLTLTFILSLTVLFIFFGKIIKAPGEYYFSAGGDGFKAYYGAMYHASHDTSAMRMDGMNYPYGEMVFFTGSQPLVVNAIRVLSKHVVDISDHTVAIMNLLMVFSFVLAALFVYLIFIELEINRFYAALAAVGICMLSPQLARFGGHFSLSWLFWLPLMIWMVLRFHRKPGYVASMAIGAITFLAGAMHMYFYAFYGFIIGLYFMSQFVNSDRKFGFVKGILFFLIQYILPFLIFQTMLSANDPVNDRTVFPYGFWAYMGHPVGVFFPSGKPYAFVPKVLTVFKHVSWESLAFIGMTALTGFVIGTVLFVMKLFKRRNPLAVSDRFVLNVLFWASFVALLFSFGLPFKLGLENLVDKIGPLRQLRALARFSWLFFYMLNIIVFYIIGKALQTKQTVTWKVVAVLAIVVLFIEGGYNAGINSRLIRNKKPVMADVNNELPENKWVGQVDPAKFQAILPIPYFHVGSENIWITSKQGTQELCMVVSLKTGLPTSGVQLSRTSISQTYKNYAMHTEPFEPLEIISDLPNRKPFLLLFNRKHYANEEEARLIRAAKLLYQDDNIELRELEIESLESLHSRYLAEEKLKWGQTEWFEKGGYLLSDTTKLFMHKSFDNQESDDSYAGSGAFEYQGGAWKNVLNDSLLLEKGKKYKLSFWMSDYAKDGHLRTVLEFVQQDPLTGEVKNYFYSDAHRNIKGFQDNWALVELNFETRCPNEKIKLTVRNSVLKHEKLLIDELVLREADLDLVYTSGQTSYKNGRRLLFDRD